jgi:hypothetical protein
VHTTSFASQLVLDRMRSDRTVEYRKRLLVVLSRGQRQGDETLLNNPIKLCRMMFSTGE